MADLDLPAELTDEPEWANDLDEAIVAGGDLPETAQRWKITDLGAADWTMRKLATLVRRAGEIDQQAKVWRARIDGWETDELRRIDGPRSFFEGLLKDWAFVQRAADPRRATFELPSGRVKTRQGKEVTVRVVDGDAVLAWARSLPAAEYDRVVKTKLSVLVSELRKLVDVDTIDIKDGFGGTVRTEYAVFHPGTGEVVPGVEAVWPETTATVEVDL